MTTTKLPRLQRIERLIRRLRNSPKLWEDNDIYTQRIWKLHKALSKEYAVQLDKTPRGPYSGLTRRELAQSGTCETDWF